MKKNINTEELSFTHGMPDESLDKGGKYRGRGFAENMPREKAKNTGAQKTIIAML